MVGTVIGTSIFLPVIVAAVASVALWKRLEHPWLFAVTAVFSLFGLQSLIAPASISVLLPGGGGITPEVARGAFAQSVLVSAAVLVLIGIPFLWWLQRALRKGGK